MRDEIKKSILKRIDALQEGYRQNIGVIGFEGLGKTTLLSSLFQELSGKPSVIPILFNAKSLSYEALCDKWVCALLRGLFMSHKIEAPSSVDSLLSAADPIVPKTIEKIRHLKKNIGREKNNASVRELFALTSIVGEETGKKVILMIDEFQELQEVIEGDVFGLLGKEIMLEKKTLFLMASSKPRQALEIFREKLSLLFSNFEVFRLPRLDSEGSRKELSDHSSLSLLPKSLREFLFHLSGGIPLYQSMILERCQEKFSSLFSSPDFFRQYADENQLTRLFLQACSEEIIHEQGRLSLFFERKLENHLRGMKEFWLGVKMMVLVSRGLHKVSEIASALNKKIQEVKKYLGRMQEEGVLSRNGSFYCIEDELFAFWLSEVYALRFEMEMLDEAKSENAIQKFYHQFCYSSSLAIHTSLENLLGKFHNDSVEIDSKKYRFPHFHDVVTAVSDHGTVAIARCKEIRWGWQIIRNRAEEKDVTAFLLVLKEQKKNFQKKILIALQGIEQNAKLLAHELKIHVWDQKDFNILLALYRLPPIVSLIEEESINHETLMGSLAQNVYTA